tara:strand:+ start:2015 stop:2200 length:186 start_codon:yes stop_codon:yes gene_type:complete
MLSSHGSTPRFLNDSLKLKMVKLDDDFVNGFYNLPFVQLYVSFKSRQFSIPFFFYESFMVS